MQIVRTNHTLKTGEVLWATIDRNESYWDMNSGVLRVSCFWFSKEDGQFYQFEGKCADLSKNVGIEMDQEIRKKIVTKALEALQTPVEDQTVFEWK